MISKDEFDCVPGRPQRPTRVYTINPLRPKATPAEYREAVDALIRIAPAAQKCGKTRRHFT